MISRSRSALSWVRLYSCQSCCASSDAIQRRRVVSVCIGLGTPGFKRGRGQLSAVSAASARPLRSTCPWTPPHFWGCARPNIGLRFRTAVPMTGRNPNAVSPFPSKGFPLPMALRVTRPTAAPVDPRDAAATALAREDLSAYRELFAATAEQEDVHARYKARRSILEAGLQGPVREAAKATAQRFAAVAAVALDALEADPREPVFLNYAGVALYELGSYAAAEALFRAAFRLSPTLPHVRENLDALVAQRRTGVRPNVPAAVSAVLPGLARRAERAGAAAQPAKDLTLSLCMIVRDEEQMLPRSLAAVRDAVDEIVVVDTGSTDRTVELAKSFGAKVIEREWTGSFAEARNASFDAATGDWVMFLDADEVLVSDDAQRLREVLGRT